MSQKSPLYKKLFYIVPLLVLLVAGWFTGQWYLSERIARGVHIYGVDFSGADKEKGLALLATVEKDATGKPVLVKCGSESWEITPGEIGFKVDKEAVLKEAYKRGNEIGLWARLSGRQGLPSNTVNIPLAFEGNHHALKIWTKRKTKHLCQSPIAATFSFNTDDTVEVIPSREGLEVNRELLWEDLTNSLAYMESPREVTIKFKKVTPPLTTQAAKEMGIKGKLAEFTTEFDSSVSNRVYNIKVAASALDGIIIKPGDEISFNETVGPRSSEAGYKTAQVIFENAMVEGIGGGVCQVSSTLYNAALLAGLQIIERTAHSLPVWYVPLGRDATVVYQGIDLKFLNDTGSHLCLKSLVGEGRLTITIYGDTEQKKEVVINSEIVEETIPEVIYVEDPELFAGEEKVQTEGSNGFKVKTKRIFLGRKDEILREEPFPFSIYKPINRIIAVGVEGEKVQDGEVNIDKDKEKGE